MPTSQRDDVVDDVTVAAARVVEIRIGTIKS
jgi:hypothetical protein